LTPAALSALSLMDAQGPQWGNLASQLGYSVGPALLAALEVRFGIHGLVTASVAGLLLSAALSWAALRHCSPHARDEVLPEASPQS